MSYTFKISNIRNTKDIGDSETVSLLIEYQEIIDKLWEGKINLDKKIPSIIDCEERLKRENERKGKQQLWIALTAALIGALIGYILFKVFT